MRLLIAALAAALALTLTMASAQAQLGGIAPGSGIGKDAAKASRQADEAKPKLKSDDKAYNAALRNLPDKQYDPWHGVR